MGGEPLAYLWVPELHKDGVHFHVHFAVGRFVPAGLIRRTWGRGHVHIKRLGDFGLGSGALEEARRVAGYLSKYVGKTFTDPSVRVPGLHRYDIAQGLQPTKVQVRGHSPEEVLDRASEILGAQPFEAVAVLGVGGLGRPAGAVGTVGPGDAMTVDRATVIAWVQESCRSQGVPERVTDPAALREIGILLGAGPSQSS